jgi:hypothetical protein
MASKIKVDQIEGSTGTTVSLPSGQTLDLSSGTVTLPDASVDLSTAKVTGTIPLSKGGTGLTSLGTANQILQVNSGATGLEFTAKPEGKILQYKKSQSGSFDAASGNWNVSSTSLTSTNITATITPTNSASKIVGTGFITYGCDGSSISALQFSFKIQRTSDNSDKTGMTPGNSYWDSEYNAGQQDRWDTYRMLPINLYDDDHGTTSEITYRLFVRGGSTHQNRGGCMYLNLFEVL